MTKTTSFRLSDPAARQLDWLAERYGNRTTAVTVAIDRLFTAERSTMDPESTLTTLADAIYSEVFGHLDDKAFRASKVQEVYDWLEAGDLDDNPDVAALADEWREYDGVAGVIEGIGNDDWEVQRTVRIETCEVSNLTAIDLSAEAVEIVERGEGPLEAARVTVEGHAEVIQVLYAPEIGRAGIAWGAGADWTDASSLEDAVRRYLGDGMKE